MRLLFFLFLATIMFAKSDKSCYTVQLLSAPYSKEALRNIEKNTYPKLCKTLHIGGVLTVRCGCYDTVEEIKPLLNELKKNYKKASLATTYKYRFSDTQSYKNRNLLIEITRKKPSISNEKIFKQRKRKYFHKNDYSDNELKMLYLSFIYSKDLENALKVASFAVKKYPNSVYWNKKMADTLQWSNKTPQAMHYLKRVYALSQDPKVEKRLVDYGLSVYQYEQVEPLVLNRYNRDPSDKNLELLDFIYKKIGEPQKILTLFEAKFERTKDTKYIRKALQTTLEMGNLELAKKYVDLLEAQKPYTYTDALLLARYYYIIRNVPKAYAALADVNTSVGDNNKTKDFIAYEHLKSDLGWYLQHTEDAALASYKTIQEKEGRIVDYERAMYYFQNQHPKLAAKMAKQGFEKYRLTYLFYTYANDALRSQHFKELKTVLDGIDETTSPLVKDAMYWMIKSQTYANLDKKLLAKEYMLRALELDKNNYQIRLSLLWFLIDLGEDRALKEMLFEIEQDYDLTPSFYFPLASAYFYLNDVNKAAYYTNLLRRIDDPITQTIQFKFLQAYIYQIQNNEEGFKTLMLDIVSSMKNDLVKYPNLKESSSFWSSYLRAAMYVLPPDKFEKKLKKAKKYLKKQDYYEIKYSWAIDKKAYEKSHKIYYKMPKKELWARFSDAIVFDDHSRIEDLLDLYLTQLSMGDSVQAADKDGQTALAQTIAFEGMSKNQKNQNVYIKHIELSKKRGDRFESKVAYYDREPLLQKYIRINNENYLAQGYSIYEHLRYSKPTSLDKAMFVHVPSKLFEVGGGVQKRFDKGMLKVGLFYHKKMRSYFEADIQGEYRLTNTVRIAAEVAKNKNALESIQLLVAGKKDFIAPRISWAVLPSTLCEFYYDYSRYTSDDNVYVGDSNYFRTALNYTLHSGYPDIQIGALFDKGLYNEEEGSKGVIDEIQSKNFQVLTDDFYSYGMSLAYGMQNRHLYTRVWRPYFQVGYFYNSVLDDYTYAVEVGAGGKVWHQDHLSVGMSYSEFLQGINDKIIEFYLDYEFMYFHP